MKQFFVCALLFTLTWTTFARAEITLNSPDSAVAGSTVRITVAGGPKPRDFLTIVAREASEGSYDAYKYTPADGTYELMAPPEAGAYEVRLLGEQYPYPTLARHPLALTEASATLDAPEQVAIGASFELRWQGPAGERDYLAIGDWNNPYITFEYTRKGSPLQLRAPDAPGNYELRYFLGSGDKIIARRPLIVTASSASLNAPAKVIAGSEVRIAWEGPGNRGDFITIVPKGAAEKTFNGHVNTDRGSPVTLLAPDTPGSYEARYLSGQAYLTLASAPMEVVATGASVQGPTSAEAGSFIDITWSGPDNPRDYITIVPAGAKEGLWENFTHTRSGNPLKLRAPSKAGEYELRYSTGQTYATLARAAITITPAAQAPGTLEVGLDEGAASAGGAAVEIILDASGSMLQRMGGERRIDIAKQTLTHLARNVIPANTKFALRVFGREVDSCQTDLDIPLAGLSAENVASRIAAIEAKNNAKTPIAASLAAVKNDLTAAKGEQLVILVTDGEETCGGDPAGEIEKLKASGIDLRVNIVGFAIDDSKLEATFAHWARAGSGNYFDAKNPSELAASLTKALQPAFEVVDDKGDIIADGIVGDKALELLPGNYVVRLKGQAKREKNIVVETGKQVTVAI